MSMADVAFQIKFMVDEAVQQRAENRGCFTIDEELAWEAARTRIATLRRLTGLIAAGLPPREAKTFIEAAGF